MGRARRTGCERARADGFRSLDAIRACRLRASGGAGDDYPGKAKGSGYWCAPADARVVPRTPAWPVVARKRRICDICRTSETSAPSSLAPSPSSLRWIPSSSCCSPQRRQPSRASLCLALLNSFVCDYAARQKVGGTHLKYPSSSCMRSQVPPRHRRSMYRLAEGSPRTPGTHVGGCPVVAQQDSGASLFTEAPDLIGGP